MRISDWSSDLCSSDRPGVTQWQKANTPLQENADKPRAIHTGSAPAAGKGAGTRPEELRTARRAEGPPAVQTPVDKTAGRGAQPLNNQRERARESGRSGKRVEVCVDLWVRRRCN